MISGVGRLANTPVRFEPFEPGWRKSPLEVFETLRTHAPVYRTPSGMWVLSRYQAVREALANTPIFSSRCIDREALGLPRHLDETADPDLVELVDAAFHGMSVDRAALSSARTVIGSDGADHDRQRRLINRAFSPRRVRDLRNRMDQLAGECVSGLASTERFDVMSGLADVIPQRIMGELLSVEEDRQPDLTRWSHQMMAATAGADRDSADARGRLLAVLEEFAHFFVPRIEARRIAPGDDFVSDLVRAEDVDALTPAETLLLIRLLMIAGTDTTAALIGNTILSLLRHPDQAAQLRADPELIPNAIEESLRYWAPFYFLLREAVETATVDDVEIPAGAVVAIMLGAANHDETEFPDPGTFDIHRQNRHHMAFGSGPHFCVGAHLARAEAQAAIEAILPYLSRFRLSDAPLELGGSQFLQGFREITVVAS